MPKRNLSTPLDKRTPANRVARGSHVISPCFMFNILKIGRHLAYWNAKLFNFFGHTSSLPKTNNLTERQLAPLLYFILWSVCNHLKRTALTWGSELVKSCKTPIPIHLTSHQSDAKESVLMDRKLRASGITRKTSSSSYPFISPHKQRFDKSRWPPIQLFAMKNFVVCKRLPEPPSATIYT